MASKSKRVKKGWAHQSVRKPVAAKEFQRQKRHLAHRIQKRERGRDLRLRAQMAKLEAGKPVSVVGSPATKELTTALVPSAKKSQATATKAMTHLDMVKNKVRKVRRVHSKLMAAAYEME